MMGFKGGDKSSGGKRTGLAAGFVGIADYLTHGKPGDRVPDRIVHFGSVDGAPDLKTAAARMQAVADDRPRVEKPLYHWGFSLPKDAEGRPLETLTPEQWEAVAYHTVSSLGLEGHQVAWAVHDDAGHQHIHLIANRVPLVEDAPTWHPSNDHYKIRSTARWAEREFGLSLHLNPRSPELTEKRVEPPEPTREDRPLSPEDLDILAAESHHAAFGTYAGLDRSPPLATTHDSIVRSHGSGPARPTWASRSDSEFRAIYDRASEPDWEAAVVPLMTAPDWNTLEADLSAAGFHLSRPSRGGSGLVLFHESGWPKALSNVHTELSGPKLRDRIEDPPPPHLDYFDPHGSADPTRGPIADAPGERLPRDFWGDTVRTLTRADTWKDGLDALTARGVVLENVDGRLTLTHVQTSLSRPLDAVHGAPPTDALSRHFGEAFEAFTLKHPEIASLPAADSDLSPLDVDRLLAKLEAHQAVWTEKDARRVARAFPNGSEVLAELSASPDVLRVDETRLTTRRIAEMEYEVFENAAALVRSDRHAVPLAYSGKLEGEHLGVVTNTLRGEALVLIEGPPGSGKTTLAKGIVDSYTAAGYEVVGASVTGKAAQGLGEETGIESTTLAAWIRKWEREEQTGRQPPARQLVLVDEASMLSLHEMKPLLERAEKYDHKVVLVGDRKQLSAVGAGDPFRRLVEDHGAHSLTKIWRQKVDWMRDSSNELVQGRVVESMRTYADRDRIRWTDTTADARSALVAHYFRDRDAHPDGSAMMIAFRNDDVRALNASIRAERRTRGEIDQGLTLGSKNFAEGDRLLFRRNDKRSVFDESGRARPVQNGSLGTLLEAREDRFTVEMDGGDRVTFDPRDYRDLDHGYAVTLYKAQGVTVDRAYVLGDRHLDRPGWTVAATRHRYDLAVYVPGDQIRNVEALAKSVDRGPEADLVRDHLPEGSLLRAYDGTAFEPSTTNPSREDRVEPIPREVLDRRTDRLLLDLHKAGRDQDLDASRLHALNRRIRDLDRHHRASENPRDHFTADRLREAGDLVTRRHHAREVHRAAVDGLEADYEAAVAAYGALPDPRLLPTPPPLADVSDLVDPSDSQDLPDHLAPRVRDLAREALRYEAAVHAPPERTSAELLEHWSERLETLRTKLDRIDGLLLERRTALEVLDRAADLPEQSLAALDVSRAETRIRALARLDPTPSALVRSLDLSVDRASDDRDRGPVADAVRAYRSVEARDRLEHALTERTPRLQALGSDRKVNAEIDRLDADFRSRLEAHAERVYSKPARALEAFDRLAIREQPEGLLALLRKDPTALGSFKRFAFPSQLRTDASAMIDAYASHLDEREGLVSVKTERAALAEEIRALRKDLLDIPDRDKLLAALYTAHESMSKEERAALPPGVRKMAEGLRAIAGEHASKGLEHMRDLGKLAGRLGTRKLENVALRLAPPKVRKLYRLAQLLSNFRKAGPAFLLKSGATMLLPLPPPVTAAVKLAQTAAAVVQILSKGKSLGR